MEHNHATKLQLKALLSTGFYGAKPCNQMRSESTALNWFLWSKTMQPNEK
jgi:hypothetical protein